MSDLRQVAADLSIRLVPYCPNEIIERCEQEIYKVLTDIAKECFHEAAVECDKLPRTATEPNMSALVIKANILSRSRQL